MEDLENYVEGSNNPTESLSSNSFIGRVAKVVKSQTPLDLTQDQFEYIVARTFEAMHEPDMYMRAAAQWYLTGDNLTVSLCVDANRDAQKVWEKMVDRALAELRG